MHIHKYINFCLRTKRGANGLTRHEWRFPSFPSMMLCCVWMISIFQFFYIFIFFGRIARLPRSAHTTQTVVKRWSCRRRIERRAYHYWVGIVIVCPAKLRDFSLLARMFVHFLEKNINFWISQFPACFVLDCSMNAKMFDIFYFLLFSGFFSSVYLCPTRARKVSETKDYFRRFWLPAR